MTKRLAKIWNSKHRGRAPGAFGQSMEQKRRTVLRILSGVKGVCPPGNAAQPKAPNE